MCIAIPGRVVAIREHEADVDVLGTRLTAGTLAVPDVAVGDFVLINAGIIVAVVDPLEAEASIALFQELMNLPLGEDEA